MEWSQLMRPQAVNSWRSFGVIKIEGASSVLAPLLPMEPLSNAQDGDRSTQAQMLTLKGSLLKRHSQSVVRRAAQLAPMLIATTGVVNPI